MSLEDVVDGEGGASGVDLTRHFSYHAYEAGRGTPRWKHEGMDFHRDMHQLVEEMIPQHNYR